MASTVSKEIDCCWGTALPPVGRLESDYILRSGRTEGPLRAIDRKSCAEGRVSGNALSRPFTPAQSPFLLPGGHGRRGVQTLREGTPSAAGCMEGGPPNPCVSQKSRICSK